MPEALTVILSPRAQQRFWAKVSQGEGRLAKWGCWIWSGQTDKSQALKYGRYVYTTKGKKRIMRAHRMMWQLVNGPIPDGLFVLHKCDDPICVKPGHLYLGTAADNTWDMRSRGRAGGTLPPHGKLTEEDVIEIREIWAEELSRRQKRRKQGLTQRDIAAAYGVSDAMICLIVNRKWWKDV